MEKVRIPAYIKTVYTAVDKWRSKYCSMIIPNQYTQTTDPKSIIEVIESYWLIFKRAIGLRRRFNDVILALKVG